MVSKAGTPVSTTGKGREASAAGGKAAAAAYASSSAGDCETAGGREGAARPHPQPISPRPTPPTHPKVPHADAVVLAGARKARTRGVRVDEEHGAAVALEAAEDAEEEASAGVPESDGLVVRAREEAAISVRDPREVIDAVTVPSQAAA